MEKFIHSLYYEKIKNQGTGGSSFLEDFKVIVYPFGKYEVKIRLTPNNEFIGIEEIKINKDFLSYEDKLSISKIIDVNEFYKEEK